MTPTPNSRVETERTLVDRNIALALLGERDVKPTIQSLENEVAHYERPRDFNVLLGKDEVYSKWLEEKDGMIRNRKESGEWIVHFLQSCKLLPACFVPSVYSHSEPVPKTGRKTRYKNALRKYDVYKEIHCAFKHSKIRKCEAKLFVTLSVTDREVEGILTIKCIWHPSDRRGAEKSWSSAIFCTHSVSPLEPARGIVRKTQTQELTKITRTPAGASQASARHKNSQEIISNNLSGIYMNNHAAAQARFLERRKREEGGTGSLIQDISLVALKSVKVDKELDPDGARKFWGLIHHIQISRTGDFSSVSLYSPRSCWISANAIYRNLDLDGTIFIDCTGGLIKDVDISTLSEIGQRSYEPKNDSAYATSSVCEEKKYIKNVVKSDVPHLFMAQRMRLPVREGTFETLRLFP